MKVFEGLDKVRPGSGGTVLTIGNFDGVHVAHQMLIKTARDLTMEECPSVTVLTFEPHPLSIVAPGREPQRLTTPTRMLELLEQAGADVVVVARSEPALLQLEAEDFVREVVQKRLAPRHIVEGASFGFGKGRRGTTELLRRIAAEFGCKVHVVDQVTFQRDGDTLVVSSSLIRELLSYGDVERAAHCLGRPYEISGKVIAGDGRGRTIGFPTANVAPEPQLIPVEGVYAGNARVDSKRFAAGISIGRTPTFDGEELRVEAHLLDFAGDLYGACIGLTFERHIRPQEKFSSVDGLVNQIRKDMDTVRECVTPDAKAIVSPSPLQSSGGKLQP